MDEAQALQEEKQIKRLEEEKARQRTFDALLEENRRLRALLHSIGVLSVHGQGNLL